MENIFSLTGKYHSWFVSNPAYKQLKSIQSELKQISEADYYFHFSSLFKPF